MVDSRLAFDIMARDDGATAVLAKVERALDRTGNAAKKNSKISEAAAKASAALTKARAAESNALDKVQVAESRLTDIRNNAKAKTSQIVTAEKALARARREAAAAGDVAQKAAKNLSKVLEDEGKSSGQKLAAGLKKWFTGDGKGIFKQVGQDGGTVFGSGIAGALKTPVLGPAIIASVGGAVAAAAPVVGSIAAAGITAGFGVGLGALGIVFAAKSVAVKNSWNRTLWSMAADMKVLSKPFEATLISMSGVAKRTFATFKPQLDTAFKTLAPSFTSFGDQLGRALERLAPALAPLADATAAALKSLGGALPDIIGKLSNQLIQLADSVSRNPDGLRDLASALGSVTDGALKTIKVLNDVDGLLNKIPGGFSVFTGLPAKLSPVKGSFDAIFASISKVDEVLAGSNVNSKALADIVNKSGAAVSAYGQAAAGAAGGLNSNAAAAAKSAHETHAANQAAFLLATAFDRQAAATQRSIDALNRRSSLLLSLSGAEIDYQQAVDDATQAIKDNGKTHDINTQKGRDNKRALDQVAASAVAQRDAMLKANDGNVAAAKSATASQGAFVRLATQMGYTKPQAIAMAKSLIAIPNVTRTAKLQANIADLQSKLSTAKKQLADGSLTKERRAHLKADIADLQSKLSKAKAALADPKLTATKKAQLKAEISDLQAKIAKAKATLASPQLTATKKAKLQAEIKQLQAGVASAKAALGTVPSSKTVTIRINTYKSLIETTINRGIVASGSGLPARAGGGPVTAGQPYLVGERGPEIWTPKASGTIIPNDALKTGQSVASGLAQGMLGGGGSAVSAAGQVAMQMITKARDVLGISSPSKAFAQLGLYITQGFSKGLLGSAKQVQASMASLMNKVLNIAFNAVDTKKAAQKQVATYAAQVAAATTRAGKRAAQARLNQAKVDLANVSSITSRLGTTSKRSAVLAMVQRENVAMQKLANARAVVANNLKAAQAKLTAAVQVRNDFKQAITDAAVAFNAITNIQAPEGGQLTASGIIAQMTETLRRTQAFAANLAKLKAKGLNATVYKQIAEAGVDQGGAIADALLGGGANTFNTINRIQSNINSAAAGLGTTAADNLYKAGVDAAQGLVNGLLAKTKALDAASKKLAAAIVAQIKKTLGIRSPSKVLEWHGAMTGQGFIRGIEGEIPSVAKTADRMANMAIPSTSMRRGPVRSGGGGGDVNIYITLQGQVIDPVGTAKQIQQLLLNLKQKNGNVNLGLG